MTIGMGRREGFTADHAEHAEGGDYCRRPRKEGRIAYNQGVKPRSSSLSKRSFWLQSGFGRDPKGRNWGRKFYSSARIG